MDLSDNRRTALALVLAILAARMLLNGRVQSIWSALWGPSLGLGTEGITGSQAQQGPVPGLGNGTSSTTTTTTTTTPANGPTIQTF